MSVAALIAVAFVGIIHVYILVLEMFLWDKPRGLRVFGQTQAAATSSKVLAANKDCTTDFWRRDCSGV